MGYLIQQSVDNVSLSLSSHIVMLILLNVQKRFYNSSYDRTDCKKMYMYIFVRVNMVRTWLNSV